MKRLLFILLAGLTACNSTEKKEERVPFSEVEVQLLLEDSLSIRAITLMGNDLGFAGSNGSYGIYNSATNQVRVNQQQHDSIYPEFRAVAGTSTDFFMLSVGNPALLYKTGDNGQMELVYKEEHEQVFYDAMAFWNDKEGIAMGDQVEGCLSIIITRDGGENWAKLPCERLPKPKEGEAAFAASNSNIAIQGDKAWILTGGAGSRVYFSPNKGEKWEVYNTPIIGENATQGGYSLHFYDEQNGVIIGGDYTDPDANNANKAVTKDGGKTWHLIADGKDPGYKSSIRYVPGSNAQEMVAVGFTGISYSKDGGDSWSELSKEGFYTLRFLNDSTAYAAGKNRLARLVFRRE